jgi:hypothetical protein
LLPIPSGGPSGLIPLPVESGLVIPTPLVPLPSPATSPTPLTRT